MDIWDCQCRSNQYQQHQVRPRSCRRLISTLLLQNQNFQKHFPYHLQPPISQYLAWIWGHPWLFIFCLKLVDLLKLLPMRLISSIYRSNIAIFDQMVSAFQKVFWYGSIFQQQGDFQHFYLPISTTNPQCCTEAVI